MVVFATDSSSGRDWRAMVDEFPGALAAVLTATFDVAENVATEAAERAVVFDDVASVQ